MKLCFIKHLGQLWAAIRDPEHLNASAGWIVSDVPLSTINVGLDLDRFDCAPIADIEHGMITNWRSPEWEAIYDAAVEPQEKPVLVTRFWYFTDKNYDDLWAIAQRQGIVCIVNYSSPQFGDSPNPPCRDVAHTIALVGEKAVQISVSARGITYFSAMSQDEFIRECERVNLDWIKP